MKYLLYVSIFNPEIIYPVLLFVGASQTCRPASHSKKEAYPEYVNKADVLELLKKIKELENKEKELQK